jgi:hypothetical protein
LLDLRIDTASGKGDQNRAHSDADRSGRASSVVSMSLQSSFPRRVTLPSS